MPVPITVTQETDVFIPRFRKDWASLSGRKFGLKKIPQTSMFQITAEGKGDFPARLKGSYTSIMEAEKAVKNFIDVEKKGVKTDKELESINAFMKPSEPEQPSAADSRSEKL